MLLNSLAVLYVNIPYKDHPTWGKLASTKSKINLTM